MPAKKTTSNSNGNVSKKNDGTKETKTPKAKVVKAASIKSLVVSVSADAVPAKVTITFTSGIGQLTTSLFRGGALVNLQSVGSSSTIVLADVQSGDSISVNGVCTGSASIGISVPTDPSTPEKFGAGNINSGYDIL